LTAPGGKPLAQATISVNGALIRAVSVASLTTVVEPAPGAARVWFRVSRSEAREGCTTTETKEGRTS
jgi:hypothetical protein